MSISLNDIGDNLTNNKIYLEPINSNIIATTHPSINAIFSDILLKNLVGSTNINKSNTKEKCYHMNSVNSVNSVNSANGNKNRYIKNSFITELIHCLYERTLLENECIKEFKNLFLSYINNSDNKDFLKTLARSYKKLQFKVNDVLVADNIDDHINIFPELIILLCKYFHINILIIYENIYKLYQTDMKNKIYLVFDKIPVKYRDDYKKIYKFREEKTSIDDILKNKNRYCTEKELNKMKLEELKLLNNDFHYLSPQIAVNKKIDIINEILKICSIYD